MRGLGRLSAADLAMDVAFPHRYGVGGCHLFWIKVGVQAAWNGHH